MTAMQHIDIPFEDVRYPFFLGADCEDDVVSLLRGLDASRYLVVADTVVARLYADSLCTALARHRPVALLTHAPGEAHKTLATVAELGDAAVAAGADRASLVVALGGGMTGNAAGLLAALLFRGIRLAHVPTTLLAMLDSVLSLKQAVNSRHAKNLFGAFHAPQLVAADTRYLQTLPAREVRAGLCELVKNALAVCPEQVAPLRRSLRPDARYTPGQLAAFIRLGIEAKRRVMRADKHERTAALVFEYGHTVGHAIEHVSGGEVRHGDAVGIGMVIAARLAEQLGLLAPAIVDLHLELLARNGSPTAIPDELAAEALLGRIRRDNKRGYVAASDDEAAFVLLRDLGEPRWETVRHPLTRVPLGDVARVLAASYAPAPALAHHG